MQAIGFNEHYGLQTAVFEGRKTMTRRAEKGFENLEEGNFHFFKERNEVVIYGEKRTPIETIKLRYKIGEIVAIRQSYKEIADNAYFLNQLAANGKWLEYMKNEAGWNNKMFVAAYYMPRHIRITDSKVERLQSISKEDCLKEGIDDDSADGAHLYWYSVPSNLPNWRELGDKVMRHEWDGEKGCWFWDTAQGAFAALINAVSGNGTWERNQFMPAYTFELID